jgi:hypothetical protein
MVEGIPASVTIASSPVQQSRPNLNSRTGKLILPMPWKEANPELAQALSFDPRLLLTPFTSCSLRLPQLAQSQMLSMKDIPQGSGPSMKDMVENY